MPITVEDVRIFTETIAPPRQMAPWDNSGLLCGNPKNRVHKILVALDVCQDTVAEAIEKKADMIVSHHPLLLQPLRRLVTTDYEGYLLTQLVKHDISLLSLHTTLDNAPNGVNQVLASILGLQDTFFIAPEDNDDPTVIGRLPQAVTFTQLTQLVKKSLRLPFLQVVSQPGMFQTIAVCGGGGIDLWPAAKEAGAQCLISADGKHHHGLQAKDLGMALIDAGHFATERVVIPALATTLKQRFEPCGVKVVASKLDTTPWQTV